MHGRRHHDRSRISALVLVLAGFARAACWVTLIALYLLGVPFTSHLFESVTFVALLSLYANAATDFGQACASLAQLTASHAHEDAEHTRRQLSLDTAQLERDLHALARASGPSADQLADVLIRRLGDRG